MKKILVSACLLGDPVRYNGKGLLINSSILDKWDAEGRIVRHCPEVAAGFPVPRHPTEIVAGNGNQVLQNNAVVLDTDGEDVSDRFITGARLTLSLCIEHGIRVAILTESSPSCGTKEIYDGSFSGSKLRGMGVTTAFLQNNGVKVFNQFQIDAASRLS